MEENQKKGHLHPISQTILDMQRIFGELGFAVAEGTEIETEEYNFDLLNVPKNHPARDLWDTFWLSPKNAGKLLRTHTSPVQIRYAKAHKPPFKVIVPGKTFRHEATDSTHEMQFHQMEGLYIDKNVSLAHLKGVLEHFVKEFFGGELQVRFRPSFFPFVEPGIEIDISRDGKKWIEVLGAGVVHPTVIENIGLDPKEYSGFAFGMGIDRLVMLKYGVDDVRSFYNGDLRLVNQF